MLERMIAMPFCAAGLALAVLSSSCRTLPDAAIAEVARPSPYDHGGAELADGAARRVVPSTAPIVHPAAFQGERETLGYRPRFFPTGPVAFAPDGTPYVRASRPDRDTGDGTDDGFIQFLDPSDGRWYAWSLVDILRRHLGAEAVSIGTNVRINDTGVVCDGLGDVYTTVRVTAPVQGAFLLHRIAASGLWQCHPLPMVARLERVGAPAGAVEGPPMVVGHLEGRPTLIQIAREPDGALRLGAPVTFGPAGAGLNPPHSGAGPVAATVGRRTYLVYAGAEPVPHSGQPTHGAPFRSAKLAEAEKGPHHPGTPQYVVCLDHDTGQVSEPVLLGFGQNPYSPTPDNHNCPSIVADSRGFLHVVLGAHQHHFWYVRSRTTTPTTRDDWTAPEALGLRRRYDCGLTYVALAIDSQDRLHLVARNMSRGYAADGAPLPADAINNESMMRTLDYLRATPQPDGSWAWEELGALVMPLWHRGYSIFYHKLALDRHGRLFLNYSTYAAQLAADTVAVYRSRWPEEAIPDPPPAGLWMRAHDPAMLMSDDGGATWRLALTGDFLEGR